MMSCTLGKGSMIRRHMSFAGLFLAAYYVLLATNGFAQSVTSDDRLKVFLRKYLADPQTGIIKTTRYVAVSANLGDSAKDAVIVYISDYEGMWCGSGGCTTLVLKPKGASYEIIGDTPATRPPFRILRSRTNGMHDIGYLRCGGGIVRCYEAALRFNGRRYKGNPTVHPVAQDDNGPTLIPADAKGEPLY